MNTMKNVALGLLLLLALGLSGCGKNVSPPPPDQQESSSIEAAKKIETGAKLKPGESKDVITPFDTVVVNKDQSGTVTYKVKGK